MHMCRSIHRTLRGLRRPSSTQIGVMPKWEKSSIRFRIYCQEASSHTAGGSPSVISYALT